MENQTVSLLQPEDSKRVADALIKTIKSANLDIASDVGFSFREALNGGLNSTLGEALVTVWEDQLRRNLCSLGDRLSGRLE